MSHPPEARFLNLFVSYTLRFYYNSPQERGIMKKLLLLIAVISFIGAHVGEIKKGAFKPLE